MNEHQEHMEFEAEVRRVAEAVWRLGPGECQPQHYTGDLVLHELDGLARLRDVTHMLMATVSRRLDKVKDDVKKLDAAEKIESQAGSPVGKWLITKYQLNAEHVKHARSRNVKVLTLNQFRRRFFDGRDYLQKRNNASFGSARNLADGTVTISLDEYVSLPISELKDRQLGAVTQSQLTLAELGTMLATGEILVLVAPFGSGKSLTVRELFLEMRKEYLKNEDTAPVPIAVNLREHWGQNFGDELLERHARAIGFSRREDLVVAWRSGMAVLLLDGFDEVASQVVAAPDKIAFMRDARNQALQGVRDILLKMPSGVGALICGRDHYFDDAKELEHSLGLQSKRYRLLRLGEFTEEQATHFLKKHGAVGTLPDWLPRKPLILGYLAHRGLLEPILQIDSSAGFGHAWDTFLNLICQREAEHQVAVMEATTLRRVLERLSCRMRGTTSGTGPITGRDLAEVYSTETGQVPGEGVLMQLQRLPGLTQRDQDPTARSFIDEDLLAALQGSAVTRTVLENYKGLFDKPALTGLSEKGIAMAAFLLGEKGADAATVSARAKAFLREDNLGREQLAADCVSIALEMTRDSGYINFKSLELRGVSLSHIDLEEVDIDGLLLCECIIDEVIVGPDSRSTMRFDNCLISRLRGVASRAGLPSAIFNMCEVSEFDDLSTNAAVVRSNLEAPLKALFTVLRKLYLQPGGGRKLTALRKGLPGGRVLDAVDDILAILQAEDIVTVFNGIAHPVRRQYGRIRQILAEGGVSRDPIVSRARAL